jgi:hypothetical protein
MGVSLLCQFASEFQPHLWADVAKQVVHHFCLFISGTASDFDAFAYFRRLMSQPFRPY